MINEALKELESGIEKAQIALKRELSKIRTGRANPDILDSVRVDYYGSPTPLQQLASISVPEARLILVRPFERTQIQAIERAIMERQLGVNPQNDGEVIRIPIPALTEERRKEFVKQARKVGEDCKVVIRKARHDAKDMIDALEKDGDVGKDEAARGLKSLEEIVKAGSAQVDEIVAGRERDILKV
ncbi:MAG: ribosome recycling factor [Myxococcales bacterium]|nr:ribosome recycling factor [Myxococcales bacterium]